MEPPCIYLSIHAGMDNEFTLVLGRPGLPAKTVFVYYYLKWRY